MYWENIDPTVYDFLFLQILSQGLISTQVCLHQSHIQIVQKRIPVRILTGDLEKVSFHELVVDSFLDSSYMQMRTIITQQST